MYSRVPARDAAVSGVTPRRPRERDADGAPCMASCAETRERSEGVLSAECGAVDRPWQLAGPSASAPGAAGSTVYLWFIYGTAAGCFACCFRRPTGRATSEIRHHNFIYQMAFKLFSSSTCMFTVRRDRRDRGSAMPRLMCLKFQSSTCAMTCAVCTSVSHRACASNSKLDTV
jgi:hypothetical protein